MLSGDYVDVFYRRGMGYDVDEHDLEVAQGEGWGGTATVGDDYDSAYEDDLSIRMYSGERVTADQFEAAVHAAEYHLMFDSLKPEEIVSVMNQADFIEVELSHQFESLSKNDQAMDMAIQAWVDAEVVKNEATAVKDDIIHDQRLVALDALMKELKSEIITYADDEETDKARQEQSRLIELVQARRQEAMVNHVRDLYELAA